MRVLTYIKYVGCGAGVIALTAAGARSQDRPVTPPPGSAQATADCSNSVWDSAALRRELAEAQSRVRVNLERIQERAQRVQAEVAREMAANGVNRDELASLVAHLGIAERYHVLGQSWGGMLAQEHAITRPPGLRSLVLSNTTAAFEALASASR